MNTQAHPKKSKWLTLNKAIIDKISNLFIFLKNAFGNVLERETAEEKHKIAYEEDNFVRKALTKKEMVRVLDRTKFI